jgi:hypothetical protein
LKDHPWLFCRHEADDARIVDEFYPLLKKSINFMMHALVEDEDGGYHFPKDVSPEYKDDGPVLNDVVDTTYNLSLLRWGIETLQFIDRHYSLNDEKGPQWKDVLSRLAAYPIDEKGLMVGADVPYRTSHRHYSHLLPFYPLHVLDPECETERPLIEKSFKHWIGMQDQWRPWSAAGTSAMAAWLGDGELAEQFLLDAIRVGSFYPGGQLNLNTTYQESGPCFETPMSVTSSLQEMLMQSWCMDPADSCIRIFPAVPGDWKDSAFHNLRAEGAFLVSAARKNGRVQFVRIKSLEGRPCKVMADFSRGYHLQGERAFNVRRTKSASGQDLLEIDLKKGEEITLLAASGLRPVVASVAK